MDDNVKRVRDLLKSNLGSTFKAYYDGDPDNIPLSHLPALSVSKLGDDSTPGTQYQDDVTERIVIKAVLNKRDDWTVRDDKTDLTEVKLRNYFEKRDESGNWTADSIKGILRRELSEGYVVIDGTMEFQLGLLNRSKDLLAHEGHLIITLRYVVNTL